MGFKTMSIEPLRSKTKELRKYDPFFSTNFASFESAVVELLDDASTPKETIVEVLELTQIFLSKMKRVENAATSRIVSIVLSLTRNESSDVVIAALSALVKLPIHSFDEGLRDYLAGSLLTCLKRFEPEVRREALSCVQRVDLSNWSQDAVDELIRRIGSMAFCVVKDGIEHFYALEALLCLGAKRFVCSSSIMECIVNDSFVIGAIDLCELFMVRMGQDSCRRFFLEEFERVRHLLSETRGDTFNALLRMLSNALVFDDVVERFADKQLFVDLIELAKIPWSGTSHEYAIWCLKNLMTKETFVLPVLGQLGEDLLNDLVLLTFKYADSASTLSRVVASKMLRNLFKSDRVVALFSIHVHGDGEDLDWLSPLVKLACARDNAEETRTNGIACLTRLVEEFPSSRRLLLDRFPDFLDSMIFMMEHRSSFSAAYLLSTMAYSAEVAPRLLPAAELIERIVEDMTSKLRRNVEGLRSIVRGEIEGEDKV